MMGIALLMGNRMREISGRMYHRRRPQYLAEDDHGNAYYTSGYDAMKDGWMSAYLFARCKAKFYLKE